MNSLQENRFVNSYKLIAAHYGIGQKKVKLLVMVLLIVDTINVVS